LLHEQGGIAVRKSPVREAIAAAIVAEVLFSLGGAAFYPQLLGYREIIHKAVTKALKEMRR
jgi:hypothetical protein